MRPAWVKFPAIGIAMVCVFPPITPAIRPVCYLRPSDPAPSPEEDEEPGLSAFASSLRAATGPEGKAVDAIHAPIVPIAPTEPDAAEATRSAPNAES